MVIIIARRVNTVRKYKKKGKARIMAFPLVEIHFHLITGHLNRNTCTLADADFLLFSHITVSSIYTERSKNMCLRAKSLAKPASQPQLMANRG